MGSCYWVGEAMHKTDFRDLEQIPSVTFNTAKIVAASAAHLASCLRQHPYPGSQSQSI